MTTHSITYAINKWLKSNNFNVRCGPAKDFSSELSKQKIYYSFSYIEEDMLIFKQPFLANGILADSFVLCFFHELGHLQTAKDITYEQWDEYRAMLKELNAREETSLEDVKRYMHSYVEMRATNWAIDFILNNQIIVGQFWESVKGKIQEYYNQFK